MTSDQHTKLPSSESLRFMQELEFVQLLSNASYLNFLAQKGYFKDPAFMAYLSYLRYWKRPEYLSYLTWPSCLSYLDLLLEDDSFRNRLEHFEFAKLLHQQQYQQWQNASSLYSPFSSSE